MKTFGTILLILVAVAVFVQYVLPWLVVGVAGFLVYRAVKKRRAVKAARPQEPITIKPNAKHRVRFQ